MGKFEQSWKEIFNDAEVSPASALWNDIDRALVNAEGETMKKRILLYQRVAAASVFFALLIGSFGIYRLMEHNGQVAQTKPIENTLPAVDEKKKIDEKNHQASSGLPENKDKVSAAIKGTESGNAIASSKPSSNLILTTPEINSEDSNGTKSEIKNSIKKSTQQNLSQSSESVHEIANNEKIHSHKDGKFHDIVLVGLADLELLPIPQIHEGPMMVEIVRKLPAIPGAFMVHEERKTVHEQVWASVTASSGGYSPNINSSSNYSYSNTASQSSPGSNSSPVVGSSYSFGMLAGMRVTKRVILQSGIQYMNQSINSTSNIGLSNSLAPLAGSLNNTTSNYATTNPYSINSANEFVSVPVQAGYLFIDRKMGLQLNTGVSTDFFIRNTLSDPSGQRQSYSQSAGQDSPYRSVNFSGLLNSEVSYKLGNRYRVSVVPGVHYSFSPVLKSASNSFGNPVAWDVGFRFRYILR